VSESSAPAAAADEPVTDGPFGDAPGEEPLTEDPVTEERAAVEVPRSGRRRSRSAAQPGSVTIVLGPRTVAALRLARTIWPIALVAVTLAACTTSSAPPAPPTARVERAHVTTAVSSSGSLTAVTEQNLGFTKGGQLKTVDVKVGQHVTTGQVLASLDDAPLRRVLAQQQGQLDSQRAALTRLVNATTVQGAQNTTNQAQDILSATQDQRSATIDADKSAVDRAEKQLDVAKDAQDDAHDALDQAKDACDASGGSSSGSGSVDASSILAGLGSGGSDSSDSDSAEEKQKKLEAALKAAGSLAGSLVSGASGANSACSQVASAQAAANSADQQVEAARTTVDAAKNRVDVDEAAQQVAVENARQGVVTAQNNLTSAQTDRPSLIAQQRGLVDAQAALVRQAQQDVDDTVLRAPADGTITAVNGAVGEFLTAGSTTTPLAPGSDAAIPGAGSSTSTTAGTVPRPGGTQFIVLDNVDQFQVVVPFEESDAVRISPNQRANVSFDAIPDLTLPGTVVSVSPSATALSGVISYYATVALTQGDPRLKNGQTAQASVLTTELDDVLTVPNSAIHHEGDKTTVTVLGFNGQRTVEFQPGAVGDDRTQVLSGLTEGDEVVVPSTAR
jgi:HlyD family secretion protein